MIALEFDLNIPGTIIYLKFYNIFVYLLAGNIEAIDFYIAVF